MKTGIPIPKIVSQAEWQTAHKQLVAKEKAATRAGDALAVERRRQPMYRIEKDYVFSGPHGPAHLRDLFEERGQLMGLPVHVRARRPRLAGSRLRRLLHDRGPIW